MLHGSHRHYFRDLSALNKQFRFESVHSAFTLIQGGFINVILMLSVVTTNGVHGSSAYTTTVWSVFFQYTHTTQLLLTSTDVHIPIPTQP